MKTIRSQFDSDAGDYEEVLPENEDEAMAYVMGKMNKGRQEKAGMKHIESAALGRLQVSAKTLAITTKDAMRLAKTDPKAAKTMLDKLMGDIPQLVKDLDKLKDKFGVSSGTITVPKSNPGTWSIPQKVNWTKAKALRSVDQRELKRGSAAVENSVTAIQNLVRAIKEASKPKVKPTPFDMPSDDAMRSGSYKAMMGSYDAKIRKKALEWRFGKDVVRRVTSGKHGGDDMYSYAIFIDGRPFVTGESQYNVAYYKMQAYKRLAGKADKLTEGK